jgi:hypothetical protein
MLFKVSANMNEATAPSGTFEVLPPGEYLTEVLDVDLKQTSTPGRMMIVIQLRVLEPSEFNNRRIFDRRNLLIEGEGPETFMAQKLRELFDAFPGCYNFETNEGDTDMLKGRQVTIRVKNEKDNRDDHKGEMQSRVAQYYPPAEEGAANVEAAPVTEAPAETAAAPAPAAPASTPRKAPAAVKPATAPAVAAPRKAPAAVKPAVAAAPAAAKPGPFRRPAGMTS